jgi:hypothetical protein
MTATLTMTPPQGAMLDVRLESPKQVGRELTSWLADAMRLEDYAAGRVLL